MNADEIYKKYVLQEKPRTIRGTKAELIVIDEVGQFTARTPLALIGGPRQSGRTTRALKSLPDDSVYVVPNVSMLRSAIAISKELGKHKLHIMSLHSYVNNHFYLGKRALNGEMVAFDHTIYESEFDRLEYDKVLDTNFRYRLAEYDIYFDEKQCKFPPEV